jgi:trk system potassium uptake protein TrkA
MYIVVVGDGKVGHALAGHLVAEGHDVAIVEHSEQVMLRNQDTVDALYVKGSGVSVETLEKAGISRADIVVAVTISDEINMLTCLTAKRLGAQYAIARIRDPEYHHSLSFLMKELLIDYVINPERVMAQEVSRILRYPFSGRIETFARGRVEMMDFRITAEDGLAGLAVKDLLKLKKNLPQVLMCAVEREHKAIIPKGDFVFREGDRVFVVSDITTITAFFKALGKNISSVRSVMIMGGSRISYYLSQMLLDMGMGVSIIEIDEEKANRLSDMLPGAHIILGDGTDQELMTSEGLTDFDAFIALSGRDEENIMAGLYAVHQGMRKVVVKNNHDNYQDLLGKIGIESAVNTKQVISNTILRTVRTRSGAAGPNQVQRLYQLIDGQVEALEFIVHRGESVIGLPLKTLKVREDVLIAVIVRDGKVRIPFGGDALEEGDRVIIITREKGVNELSDVIRRP